MRRAHKIKALDLCCKAGGVSAGLVDAGFDVTGVDLEPQPNYRHKFIHANALEVDLAPYDFIWASPPCQKHTAYGRRKGYNKPETCIIAPLREKLKASGKPYVIENVVGAPLLRPYMLCGSMFGLDVQRHRLFETSFTVLPRKICAHYLWKPRFPPATNRKNLRKTVEVGVWRIPLETQKKAMGVDWNMTLTELSNAIPPAYSRFIAERWLEGARGKA